MSEKDENQQDVSTETQPIKKTSRRHRLADAKRWYLTHKRISLPLTVLLLVIVMLGVPTTRYLVLGSFWKEDVVIEILDSEKKTPVSEAVVSLAGVATSTDAKGQARLTVPVGNHQLKVTKKYYKTASVPFEVTLFNGSSSSKTSLQATGRLTSIKVSNKINGQPVQGALIDAGKGNQGRTDSKGAATIVAPAGVKKIQVDIGADKYVFSTSEVSPDSTNDIAILPEGRIFFLSKGSGKIDVVSSNLDGSDRKIVLEGTGHEDDRDTSLLASRDWQYLALKAKRNTDSKPSLWLITTKTADLTRIDTGNIDTDLIGWSGGNFWYSIDRLAVKAGQPKRQALKTLNAQTQQLSIVDETDASGTTSYDIYAEDISWPYILEDRVVYVKTWSQPPYDRGSAGKKHTIMTVDGNGQGRKTLKEFNIDTFRQIQARLYKPQEVYFVTRDEDYSINSIHELEDGVIKEAKINESEFYRGYPTYIMSPSGKQTLWKEARDGKNTLLVGNVEGAESKVITAGSEFTPYGWLTDGYILLQKNNSELYSSSIDALKAGRDPIKISDYHKASYGYEGYGYGYGGQ